MYTYLATPMFATLVRVTRMYRHRLSRRSNRSGKFSEVEEKLLNYIDLRSTLYSRDKCGLSWTIIQEKALKFAEELGVEGFMASPGWVLNALNRGGKISVALHGEGMEMSVEERGKLMTPWKQEPVELIAEKNLSAERIYNADQTGLFYRTNVHQHAEWLR